MDNIDFTAYIRPELLILTIPIYLVGAFVKRTNIFKDKYIPIILGCLSFLLCLIYLISVEPFLNVSTILNLLVEAFIQGILIAACDVYVNQIVKQLRKGVE